MRFRMRWRISAKVLVSPMVANAILTVIGVLSFLALSGALSRIDALISSAALLGEGGEMQSDFLLQLGDVRSTVANLRLVIPAWPSVRLW